MTTPEPNAATRAWVVALVAGAAVVVASLLLPRVALRTSPTSDEAAHLSAGVASLETGDYRLNPEHPPLLKTLAGLPVWLAGAELPMEQRAWDRADIWRFGDAFLTTRGEEARWWLALGRVAPMLLALCLVGFVAAWATRLHGPVGGALSGGLAALDPSLIGHGGLVTNDVSFTLVWLVAVASFHALGEHNTLRRRLLAGLALGLALSTKFSALLLMPLLPLLVFAPVAQREGVRALLAQWRAVLTTCLTVVAVATGLVTLAYEGNTGLWFQGLHVMRGGAEAYLLGQRSGTGFLAYFVVALALKVPLATWLGAAAGLPRLVRGPSAPNIRALQGLVVTAAFFLVAASLARLNIGARHVMPVHATLWLLAGGAAPTLRRVNRWLPPLAVTALLGWAAADLARAWPSPIAWINPIAGGPESCGRYLGDSNCDWGQGLMDLAAWQRQNAPQGVYLAYFGNADPAAWGVRAAALPAYGPIDGREPKARLAPTGWPRLLVVVSTSNLQGLGLDGLDLYRFLADRAPLITVGGSLHVFDLSGATDRRQLAEACRRAKWPRTAAALERWWPPKAKNTPRDARAPKNQPATSD